jgi:uncharacterized protein YqjF (DUF2071 family)
MHPSLNHLDHRPWTIPQREWSWRQNWYDLLFAHWPIPIARVRPFVPAGLTIQEFNGTSWIGVIPFRMTGVMRRPLPDLPWISAFPELNVRVYVERDGKPGVWFLSLDATNRLAVWAARRFFHLPYWHSRIEFSKERGRVRYRCTRRGTARPIRFEAEYGSTAAPALATKGSLEQFLAERYCLYAQSSKGRLYRCEVHHQPWPLQIADGHVEANDMVAPFGLAPLIGQPIMHFSKGVETVVWSPEELP